MLLPFSPQNVHADFAPHEHPREASYWICTSADSSSAKLVLASRSKYSS